MITRIRLVHFRSHADTELSLQPMNLFVGPAASGKSNIFKGLLLIQNSVHRSLIELFPPGLGEFHWVRSRWAGETDPVGFEVDLEGLPGFPGLRARYTLKIADSPPGLYVLEETLQRRHGDEEWQWVFRRRNRKQRMGEFGEVDPYEPTLLNRAWSNLPWRPDPRVNGRATGVHLAREVREYIEHRIFPFGSVHAEKPGNRPITGSNRL